MPLISEQSSSPCMEYLRRVSTLPIRKLGSCNKVPDSNHKSISITYTTLRLSFC